MAKRKDVQREGLLCARKIARGIDRYWDGTSGAQASLPQYEDAEDDTVVASVFAEGADLAHMQQERYGPFAQTRQPCEGFSIEATGPGEWHLNIHKLRRR